MEYYPSFEQFRDLAGKGTIVPVSCKLMSDALTPVSAFDKLHKKHNSFLLESVVGGEKIGRFSLLGVNPFSIFRARRNMVEIIAGRRTRTFESPNPIESLAEYVKEFRPVPRELIVGPPVLSAGAFGYFAYDVVRYTENLPDSPPDTLHLPDIYFMFYDGIVVFDHVFKTLYVAANARLDTPSPRKAYDAAIGKIERIVDRLRTPVAVHTEDMAMTDLPEVPFESTFEKHAFEQAVVKCKEYIKAGDIFQVVLSQRLHARTDADPFNIYRALRVINPSPYMFLLRLEGLDLVGASPEVMVKVQDGQMTLRPIAGTRRRGSTDDEDKALEQELLSDPKERAEHIMLVDLGRNDVGRVAEFNSVKIDDQMVIERYSHVMHIVSSVSGRLKPEHNAFNALEASLPAGTLSGAPKVRAMQILDELEPTRRGPYGGAVGYIDFYGNMNTCITIRTLALMGNDAYVQAGAGIVADSVPENEYDETLNKARSLLKAIAMAEGLERS